MDPTKNVAGKTVEHFEIEHPYSMRNPSGILMQVSTMINVKLDPTSKIPTLSFEQDNKTYTATLTDDLVEKFKAQRPPVLSRFTRCTKTSKPIEFFELTKSEELEMMFAAVTFDGEIVTQSKTASRYDGFKCTVIRPGRVRLDWNLPDVPKSDVHRIFIHSPGIIARCDGNAETAVQLTNGSSTQKLGSFCFSGSPENQKRRERKPEFHKLEGFSVLSPDNVGSALLTVDKESTNHIMVFNVRNCPAEFVMYLNDN